MIDPSPDITALRQNIHARLDDLNARMVGAAVWLLDDRRRLTRLEAVRWRGWLRTCCGGW